MVLGTPMQLTPRRAKPDAIDMEPSPPITTIASSPFRAMFSRHWPVTSRNSVTPFTSTACLCGSVLLFVPRMVPPTVRMLLTDSLSSRRMRFSINPRKPSSIPTTSRLYFARAGFVTALMTAFRPGQSPPAVITPIRCIPFTILSSCFKPAAFVGVPVRLFRL